jgi:hypothetical protein
VLESGAGAINMPFGGSLDIPLPPPYLTPQSSSRAVAARALPVSPKVAGNGFVLILGSLDKPKDDSLVAITGNSDGSQSGIAGSSNLASKRRANQVHDFAIEQIAPA